MTRLLPLGLFLLLAGLLGVALYWGPRDELPSPLIGKPVPAIALPGLTAEAEGLTPALFGAGKPVVLNVFASWCAPCRLEHPLLMALATSHGATVYGIAYKNKLEDAVAFLAELGNPFAAVGLDESGRAGIELGVYGVPETFIIDGAGRIAYRHAGPLTPEILSGEILPRLRANGS